MKKIIAITLILLTVFAGNAYNGYSAPFAAPEHISKADYNYDGHYWTVYLVAVLLKIPEAKELAFYAELPDCVSHDNGMPKRATMTWLNVFMQGKVHALTGKHPEKERERSRKMYATAVTMKDKGRALHRLGDSYAHAKPCETKMYKRGVGHAFTPEHGHAPDMIRNYPEKYLTYVKDLARVLGGPDAKVDMTAFEYIAKMKLETEDNIEILKAEIAIQLKSDACEISSLQSKTLQAYLDCRTGACGVSCQMKDLEVKSKKKPRMQVLFSFPQETKTEQ